MKQFQLEGQDRKLLPEPFRLVGRTRFDFSIEHIVESISIGKSKHQPIVRPISNGRPHHKPKVSSITIERAGQKPIVKQFLLMGNIRSKLLKQFQLEYRSINLLFEPVPFNRRPDDMLKKQYSIVGNLPILLKKQ